MPSIDERVVAMSFENSVFESRVATTMTTLSKLDTAIKTIGSTTGLENIEKAANKVTLEAPMSALDKLKARLSRSGEGAAEGMGEIEKAGEKVTLQSPSTAVDKLQSKIGQLNAGTTFSDIEKAASRVDFSGFTSAIENLGNKFSVLEGAASVALGNIVTQAGLKGAAFAKSFSFAPIQQGFEEYQTNLNSIQTILANTADSGGNLRTVNAALDELNTYSDKTIYNFSEMAKNIGTFTAAGVRLKPATEAIKGIANLAALSGSNSQQASTAMYQLSQAIAAGKVGLQDWNSVVNAGMGGAVFQKALSRTAEQMGTLADGAVKVDKATGKATINGESFRESIMAKPGQESWLTSEVLTKTLSQFTGDLSDAQLAAQGFNAEQIKSIQQTAKLAQAAATEVKTLPQVFDVAKETIGSGWSATFRTIFGDFEESKKTFTEMSNTINGFINTNANARNKVLDAWKDLGGRAILIDGIKNVFNGLIKVISTVKDAFRDIFPAKTGQDLFEFTKNFEAFSEKIFPTTDTVELLRRTFKGFFALLDIGKQVISGVADVFKTLVGSTGAGNGKFLEFTANLGDSLVKLDEWLKEGNRLKKFFTDLGQILITPIVLFGRFKDVITGLFDGVDRKDAFNLALLLDGLKQRLEPLVSVLDTVKKAWDGFVGIFDGIKTRITPALKGIADAFSGFGALVTNAFKTMSFDDVFKVIQTGLVAGIFVAIKKALGGGLNIDVGGGLLKSITGTFHGLTDSLKTMQQSVQAGTLLKIAAALAVLTVSLIALSMLDADKLAKALTATAVGLGELMAAMAIINSIGGGVKVAAVATSLIALAVALDVLVIAVKALSDLSWEELAKGLTGVGALLLGLSVSVSALSGGSAKLLLIGPGLIAVAVAMRILAESVKVFGEMDWESMGKGLLGMATALAAIGLGVTLIPPSILLIGPGLLAVGLALGAISAAVLVFGSMKWETLGKGLLGMAAALVAIAVGVALMPPTLALQAAGLVLVGVALAGIAGAIALMGNLSIGTLAKGIIAIGAALVVLAAGLTLMIASLPGAAALLVAATALGLLVPILGVLGTMSWGTIGKGLAAIAASMLVIGTAGLIAAPALTVLSVALLALGIGLTAVGAGVYLIAKGISILANDGSKGVAVFIAALTGLVALAPKIAIDFAKGLLQILESISNLAPLLAIAIAKILDTALDVIIKSAPKIATAFTALVTAGINILADNGPRLIEAGFNLLIALLKGINDHIEDVTIGVSNIVIKFLSALAEKIPDIVRAGADALAAYLKGIADNLGKVISAGADLIGKFLVGVVNAYVKVISAGADAVLKFISGIASKLVDIVKTGGDIIVSFIRGIGEKAADIATAGVDSIITFIKAISKEALKLGKEGSEAVINFINGVANEIRKADTGRRLGEAGANLANAIIVGMLNAFDGLSGGVIGKLVGIAEKGLKGVKDVLGIHSPSTVFKEVGANMMKGWAIGIDNNSNQVGSQLQRSADRMVNTMIDSIRSIPNALDGLIDMEPTIRPVLDLTNIQNGAKQLNGIIKAPPLSVDSTYRQASNIATSQQVSSTNVDGVPSTGAVTEIKFEQNNYSPESLSTAEIYRKTKSQVSQVRGVLDLLPA